MQVSLIAPFKQWVYSKNSILYVLRDDCDDCEQEQQSIKSPVHFADNEISIINKCLESYTIEDLSYNTKQELKRKIDIFDKYFNTPGIACLFTKSPVLSVIELGELDILKYIYNVNIAEFVIHKPKMYNEAISNNRFEILKWLNINVPNISCFNKAILISLSKGYDEITNWLLNQHISYDNAERILYESVKYGNLQVIKWLYSNNLNLHKNDILTHVISKVINHKTTTNQKTTINQKIEIIKYIIDIIKPEIKNITIIDMIATGNLDIIEYVYDRCDVSTATMLMIYNTAAEYGYMHIIKWVCEKSPTIKPSDVSFNYALSNGHMDIVNYILDINPNVSCTYNTIRLAAENGHLEALKYICEKFPKYNDHYIQILKTPNDIETLRFMFDHFKIKVTSKLLTDAVLNNNLDTYILLREHGPRTSYCDLCMRNAIITGNLEFVKYIFTENPNCTIKFNTLNIAKERKHHDVIRWIINNGYL